MTLRYSCLVPASHDDTMYDTFCAEHPQAVPRLRGDTLCPTTTEYSFTAGWVGGLKNARSRSGLHGYAYMTLRYSCLVPASHDDTMYDTFCAEHPQAVPRLRGDTLCPCSRTPRALQRVPSNASPSTPYNHQTARPCGYQGQRVHSGARPGGDTELQDVASRTSPRHSPALPRFPPASQNP